jgi:hypothetical protein
MYDDSPYHCALYIIYLIAVKKEKENNIWRCMINEPICKYRCFPMSYFGHCRSENLSWSGLKARKNFPHSIFKAIKHTTLNVLPNTVNSYFLCLMHAVVSYCCIVYPLLGLVRK